MRSASPKDKHLKVNSSTGALITAFDGDGVADAPAGNMEAMTYLADGSTSYLYMISNDRHLLFRHAWAAPPILFTRRAVVLSAAAVAQ